LTECPELDIFTLDDMPWETSIAGDAFWEPEESEDEDGNV
jgi:hypothetical protein